MKIFVLIILILSGSEILSQQANVDSTEKSFKFGFQVMGGYYLNKESRGFNLSGNFQLKNEKNFGFGADISRGFYESPNLNRNPSVSQVDNYDEAIDGPLPQLMVNGSNDFVFTLSPYLSKGIHFLSWISIDLQGGPSLVYIKERDFIYKYSPGFPGTFSGGGSPPTLRTHSTSNSKLGVGGYFRSIIQVYLTKGFIFELSPFVNINTVKSNMGLQVGFGFRF